MNTSLSRTRPFRPLSRRVVAWALLYGALFTLAMTAVLVGIHYLDERDAAIRQLRFAADSYKKSLANSLWDLDMPSARLQVDALANFPMVGQVAVDSAIGQTITAGKHAVPPATDDDRLSWRETLVSPQRPDYVVGQLRLHVDGDAFLERVKASAVRILVGELIKGLAFGLLMAWLIDRLVTRHLADMASQVGSLNPVSLRSAIVLRRQAHLYEDELDRLRDAFNTLHRDLAGHIEAQRLLESELRQHRDSLSDMVATRTQALEQANRELQLMSRHDALTGVANRRHFDETKEVEFRRAMRAGSALSVLMCDLDDFKRYNDTYGHAQGDRCLIDIANCIGALFGRAGELLVRLGGEEFAVLLPNVNAEQALAFGERIRQAIWDLNIAHASSLVADRVTISVGIATLRHGAHKDFDALLHDADVALYKAKEGRNRVAAAE